jgi:hypothetical protein
MTPTNDGVPNVAPWTLPPNGRRHRGLASTSGRRLFLVDQGEWGLFIVVDSAVVERCRGRLTSAVSGSFECATFNGCDLECTRFRACAFVGGTRGFALAVDQLRSRIIGHEVEGQAHDRYG